MLAQLFHETLDHLGGNLVDTVVVIAEGRILAVDLVIHRQARFIANDMHLGVLDRRQRISHHRDPGNAAGHGTQDVHVVQRHLDTLIGVTVVHVVDDIQCVHIRPGQPVHHVLEALHHFLKIEDVGGDRRERGGDLFAADFVTATVDRVQQRLGKVDTSAKELHLLAGPHRRHTAGDRVVVAPILAHQVVVFILDRAGFDRLQGAVVLEALRQQVRPKHSQVRLGGRAERRQRMQEAEAVLRHQRTAIDADAANRFGHPGRVAREQRVVVMRPQETHHAQLDDQVVHQFLGFRFGHQTFLDVAFDVDVEERADAADRHGGAILLLDRGQIAEISPLDRLVRIARRLRNIETIALGHLAQFFQRHQLTRQFFAQADGFFLDDVETKLMLLGLLVCDQEVQTVEGDTAVVADDAAAAIGIGQTGDDAGTAGTQHVFGVGVEHALIVCAAVFAEHTLNFRIDLVAVFFERLGGHADAAKRHHRPLQRLVGLQTDNLFAFLINIAGRMRGDIADDVGIGIDDATLGDFLLVELKHLIPDIHRALGRRGEERTVTEIRRVIAVNEVANVDFLRPESALKALPGVLAHRLHLALHAGFRRGCCLGFVSRFLALGHKYSLFQLNSFD